MPQNECQIPRLPPIHPSVPSSHSRLPPLHSLPLSASRHSVSYLVVSNGTTPVFPSRVLSSPTSITSKNFGGISTSNEDSTRDASSMRDVAHILSTLKDRMISSETQKKPSESTRQTASASYWKTVLGTSSRSAFGNSEGSSSRLDETASDNKRVVSGSTRWKGTATEKSDGRVAKSHRCNQCGQCFRQRGAMHSHVRGVHRQERPYMCDYDDCTAAYKYRGDLNRHKDTVHRGAKPYPCNTCGIPFARKSVRDRHARKKHGVGRS